MKHVLTACVVSFLLLTYAISGRGQAWRRIVPLKSTRTDVEQLLGPSKEVYFADYKLKDGNLFIEYSSGPCRPDRKGGWNVPENTVVLLSFTPRIKKSIKSLKLDPQKFRKVVGTHVGGVIYYINDEDGISYEVQEGKIDSVEYAPRKRDNHLYCGDPA